MRKQLYLALFVSIIFVPNLNAQKIGFIDSQVILDQLPESKDAKRRLEVLTTEWQTEIKRKREALDKLVKDFQAKEVLYTEEIKLQKRKEMIDADKAVYDFQNQKFGVDGEYFRKQNELMKPVQDRLYSALKAVAVDEDYDYVFDRASDTLLLYANETHNLTGKVLDRLVSAIPESTPSGTGAGGK